MKIESPHRASHTYLQRLEGPPEQVFPLLCPVRECEWVNGWDPTTVITESGVAEQDCIFVIGPEDDEATWVIVTHEPPVRIEFLRVVPKTSVGRIHIHLRPHGLGGTAAEITYTHTAISDGGRKVVDEFTAEAYTEFMREWEAELNHFLRTGEKKPRR